MTKSEIHLSNMQKNFVKDTEQKLRYIHMNTQIQEVVGLNMVLMILNAMIVVSIFLYLTKNLIYKCLKLELNGETWIHQID